MFQKKAYIITIDKGGGLIDGFNYENFHAAVLSIPGIVNWWHYLQSTYIVITQFSTSAHHISNHLIPVTSTKQKQFFVCQLNLKDHNGFLPKEAWDWIGIYINDLGMPYIS